eukprot:1898801-Pleurochrysis_carterae.AAC.3
MAWGKPGLLAPGHHEGDCTGHASRKAALPRPHAHAQGDHRVCAVSPCRWRAQVCAGCGLPHGALCPEAGRKLPQWRRRSSQARG